MPMTEILYKIHLSFDGFYGILLLETSYSKPSSNHLGKFVSENIFNELHNHIYVLGNLGLLN